MGFALSRSGAQGDRRSMFLQLPHCSIWSMASEFIEEGKKRDVAFHVLFLPVMHFLSTHSAVILAQKLRNIGKHVEYTW